MSIGKIQRMLSHGGAAGVVNSQLFITALVGDLCSSLLDPNKIHFVVEVDEAQLASATAIALASLLIERINNALKHAFREGEEGTLNRQVFQLR
jgi:two-component sensor histidine kinase